MQYLRENTATRITVGPFLDVTDAVTPEIALTATNEHLTFIVDDAGVPTLVLDTTATASGGSNDLVHITSDAAGYYDLELTAANTNYTGRARLSINYVTDHIPVFHEYQIVSANVYDSLFTDGDVLDVSMTQIGGDAQSLTDLKDFADAGYDPATNKVQGVVLTDTITTYTGNTLQTGDTFAQLPTNFADLGITVTTGYVVSNSVVGNLGGNVLGNVNGSVATATALGGDAVNAAAVAADALAEIKAQVVAALDTDTYAEPSAPPAATASLVDKIAWTTALARNKITQTDTTQTLRNDGDAASIGTAAVSDNGTTTTRAEWA